MTDAQPSPGTGQPCAARIRDVGYFAPSKPHRQMDHGPTSMANGPGSLSQNTGAAVAPGAWCPGAVADRVVVRVVLAVELGFADRRLDVDVDLAVGVQRLVPGAAVG